MTEPNEALLSPCGLYCGVCAVFIAHRDGNEKFKQGLAKFYGVEPDQVRCEGCRGPEEILFSYCRTCPIRSCATEKGLDGCHRCAEFPCAHIAAVELPVGKQVMLRAVPRRREIGDRRWAREEEERYRCPACSKPLFRGARRCRNCGTDVDLD
ncbi:MAG: DUF3795 domain-containing protein [Desulfobacterales bacterium]|jgi:hypothetical protein